RRGGPRAARGGRARRRGAGSGTRRGGDGRPALRDRQPVAEARRRAGGGAAARERQVPRALHGGGGPCRRTRRAAAGPLARRARGGVAGGEGLLTIADCGLIAGGAIPSALRILSDRVIAGPRGLGGSLRSPAIDDWIGD